MAKRTIGLALSLLLCGALPEARSFSLRMSATLPTSTLSHPNDPKRNLQYRNLDAGMNGGLRTTKAGGTLLDDLAREHKFTPLERMFLTLSGNVQTAFSSYYLREVEIAAEMKPADITPPTSPGKLPLAVFDRNVKVNVGGLKCFKVTSKVKVYDPILLDAYTTRMVGLDQLLKMFNIRPKFTLQDAGRNDDGGIWRFYTLECHKGLVDFEILEEFENDAFELDLPNNRRIKSQILHPNFPNRKLTKANDNNIYNIRDELTTMSSGGNLIYYLADAYDLTPLERVAITANGQLQMMFSSYYLGEVDVAVTRNVQMDIPSEELSVPKPPIAMFDREVLQTISGHLWCKATSIVRLYDEEVLEAYNSMGIGNLLRKLNLNPQNELHDAGRSDDGGMWRFYTMACPGVIEFDILEEIPANGWDLPCMPEQDVSQPSLNP